MKNLLPPHLHFKANCKNGFTLSIGIFNTTAETLTFFPNPLKIILHLKGTAENAEVTIPDTSGKQLIDTKLNLNGIDVSTLKTGNFIIKIADPNGIRVGEFMK